MRFLNALYGVEKYLNMEPITIIYFLIKCVIAQFEIRLISTFL